MAVSVAVAVGDIADELVNKINDKINKLKVAPWTDKDADMGPLISKEHLEKGSYIETGINEGAKIISDGRNYKLQDMKRAILLGQHYLMRLKII